MGAFVENKIVNYIKNYNNSMSEDDESILRYGIQIYYFTISKLVVIMAMAILLNVFWEVCAVTLLIGGLKKYAYGFHADTFWSCIIISVVNFFGIVYLAKLSFGPYAKILIILVSLIIFYIYAPADTEERPLVDAEERKKMKYKAIITAIVYCLVSLFVKEYLSNMIILSLMFVGFNTCPIPYKIFKKEYNNYEKYV